MHTQNKIRILIVDDNELCQRLAAIRLGQSGFELILADDGRDALEILAGSELPLPIVLLDLKMPNLNGEEFIKIIRDDPRLFETYIVVISADAYPDSINKVLALGANQYLTKPYSREALEAALSQALADAESCRRAE